MKNRTSEHQRHVFGREWLKVFVYAFLLFAAGLAWLWKLLPEAHMVPPAVLAGFFAYTLFTIIAGYRHPYFGYISMDRAGQLLCLLTLGPFHAAWISGFSYFLFSWLRLRQGVPLRNTINAVLVNTGMMTLMLLLAGSWYQWLGGEIPLQTIDVRSLLITFSTLVLMQVFNDLAMFALVFLRGGKAGNTFIMQAALIELGTGLVGMTLALVYNRGDQPLFLLVLLVISIGMVVMKQYASIRIHLETLVRERTQALEDQAQRDALTGLANRRHADDFLTHQIALAQQTRSPISIVMMDIDRFKTINDNFLHATGDKVLQRLAELLKENCRTTDLVSRYGGEEFLICFPLLDIDGARLAAEKLRLLVAEENWAHIEPTLQVTISMGVAQWQTGMRAEELIKAADRKLYEAKSTGRNRVCC